MFQCFFCILIRGGFNSLVCHFKHHGGSHLEREGVDSHFHIKGKDALSPLTFQKHAPAFVISRDETRPQERNLPVPGNDFPWTPLLIYQPDSSGEVFTFFNSTIPLFSCVVKALIGFVSFEYKFEKPAVLITGIRSFRLQVLVGFEYNYAEKILFFCILPR